MVVRNPLLCEEEGISLLLWIQVPGLYKLTWMEGLTISA